MRESISHSRGCVPSVESVSDTVFDTVGRVTNTVSDTVGCVTNTLPDTVGSVSNTVSDTAGSAAGRGYISNGTRLASCAPYLTESVHKVVSQKSTPPQIRLLILYYRRILKYTS